MILLAGLVLVERALSMPNALNYDSARCRIDS